MTDLDPESSYDALAASQTDEDRDITRAIADRRSLLWDPERWAERTLDVHVDDGGICGHCKTKYGERRRWPCYYAQVAIKIRAA